MLKENIELYTSMTEKYESRFVCNQDTDIVIEGFPRSANTFFVDYLSLNNTLKVAHHTHDNRNILLGIAFEVPSVVLVRNPLDAIISYSIYSGMKLENAAQRYKNFYSSLIPLKKDLICAEFSDVVNTPELIVSLINERSSLKLKYSADQSSDIALAKRKDIERAQKSRSAEDFIKTVGAPNAEREKIKISLRDQAEDFIEENPDLHDLYSEMCN